MNVTQLTSIARKCGDRTTDCQTSCPFYGQADCTVQLINALADKAQEQRSEIERLKEEHDKNFEKWEILDKRTKERYAELYEEAKVVVRAEGIKAFEAEMRKRKTTVCGIPVYLIEPVILDNLVKELISATNEK